MPERNIATQTGLEDLKASLVEIAENLHAHINASLKVHGINLVTGYVDANGNDRTTYQDSYGVVVGSYFVRFVVEDEVYYAPAQTTVLSGQGESDGDIDTDASEAADTGSQAAWITNYTSEDVTAADAINNEVLVAHSRVPHRTAHGGLTVAAETSFGSSGSIVGTHVIRMRIGEQIYKVICTPRIGGPLQPPRGTLNYTYDLTGGTSINEDHPANPPDHFVTITGGTLPTTIRWYVSQDNVTFFELEGSFGTLGNVIWSDIGVNGLRTLFAAPGRYYIKCVVENEASSDLEILCINDIYER